ncbi:hypothetical protein UA08_06893 [Talaromyces atroroseus]|uniref:Tat pathway signal sequence n=1 Tax=Talaromyces atroroseus TaxID=1441469 RepID=A0A225APG7_TALAT|nr:hypothetical protein UA08_06893 [Talaromyces atroroseus]OKL57499.1 hypothetical protein UA08_06893 [Talaromyces atroroseus]
MSSESYQRIAQKPEEEGFLEGESGEEPITISNLRLSHRKQQRLIVAQWILLILLLMAVVGMLWKGQAVQAGCPYKSKDGTLPDHVYSPAENAIRYKNLAFTTSISPHLTKYQGPPTPENLAAWEDLYSCRFLLALGVSRIPMSEAAKLVNKTVPIPDYPGEYVIQLDVFHQLHCLNMIRLKLWAGEGPEYYLGVNETLMDMDHLDHCIDSMRQSFMCSSDISPITWKWVEDSQSARGLLTTLHTCRDFEAIREWALEHEAKSFDIYTHVPDPLEDST